MGLSLVEMAIGRYPIPPPEPKDLASIFGDDSMKEHLDASQSGRALKGYLPCFFCVYFPVLQLQCFKRIANSKYYLY